jgi:hypothetical protein
MKSICPECGGEMYPEDMLTEKKDACYYKVKSRYKIWPSAYACVPEHSSKALTRDGFKSYSELSIGEEIMTYNIEKNILEFKPILNLHHYENAPTKVIKSGNTGFIVESTANHRWVVQSKKAKKTSMIETTEIVGSNKRLIVSAPYHEGTNIKKDLIYKYNDNWVKYLLEISSEQRQSWLWSAIVYDGDQKKINRIKDKDNSISDLEHEYTKKNNRQMFGFKQKNRQHLEAFLLAAYLNGGTITWKKYSNKDITSCYYTSNKFVKDLCNFKNIGENVTSVWCPETENQTWVMMQETGLHGIITITGNSGALVKCRKRGAKNWGNKTKKESVEAKLDNVEQLDELKCWPGYTRVKGVPAGAPGSCKKKKKSSESIVKKYDTQLVESMDNILRELLPEETLKMLVSPVRTSTFNWATLDPGLTLEDKCEIFESHHSGKKLIETNDRNIVDIFKDLSAMSETPVVNKKYIVVALALMNNTPRLLNEVNVMTYKGSTNSTMKFDDNGSNIELPSTYIRQNAVYDVFTFSSVKEYDKFVVFVNLRFGIGLPDLTKDNNPNDNLSEDSMSLRDWFGKGKHGGAGGGGWDRYNSKGERIGKCGERKPGEGKPKCLSKGRASSLRSSGGKKAIARAVNKKRREDTNAERSGKADMVSNKTKKVSEATTHNQNGLQNWNEIKRAIKHRSSNPNDPLNRTHRMACDVSTGWKR